MLTMNSYLVWIENPNWTRPVTLADFLKVFRENKEDFVLGSDDDE